MDVVKDDGTMLIYGFLRIFLVYWGLTPQQQPGSYRGGNEDDDDDEMSVSLVEETGQTHKQTNKTQTER